MIDDQQHEANEQDVSPGKGAVHEAEYAHCEYVAQELGITVVTYVRDYLTRSYGKVKVVNAPPYWRTNGRKPKSRSKKSKR